jgi:hypothetical protein
MHLLQQYSLACGAKIHKPFALSKFFPIAPERYITFHPTSKFESKIYDAWQDVIDILYPILNKEGITIVQIGGAGERIYKDVYTTVGQTNFGQSVYVISHGILHLGADSFACHVASAWGKKIVGIYSNNFSGCVYPYWTATEDMILIDSPKGDNKPSFSQHEDPKTINEIPPEQIAEAVCKLLKLKFTYPYKRAHVGSYTKNIVLENVPNQIIDPRIFGTENVVMRMDYCFDEQILIEQLKRCQCSIVTDKPIDGNILREFRGRIKDIIYDLKKGYSVNFVKEIVAAGLQYYLITSASGDELNQIKLDFLDFNHIHPKQLASNEEIEKWRQVKDLFYKTAKVTLSKGQVFPSKAAWIRNIPCDDINDLTHPIIDCPEFWEEFHNFKLLTKVEV